MPAIKNKQILLASRPTGEPSAANFNIVESEMREPAEGEILLKTLWLSLDPYMRGRMSAAKSYAKPVEVGELMVGGTVSEVVASKHKDYKPGDVVLSYDGWQQYALSKGVGLRKLDPKQAPVQVALSAVSYTHLTLPTILRV